MRLDFIKEPELEFAQGKHIDVRFGIMKYGPFDINHRLSSKGTQLGVIGSAESVDGILAWLEKCRSGIQGKRSRRPNLFPCFPGYGEESPFGTSLIVGDGRLFRKLRGDDIQQLYSVTDPERVMEETTSLFLTEIRYLAEETHTDVIVCSLPKELLALLHSVTESSATDGEDGFKRKPPATQLNFHHLLKARAMRYGKPIQIVLPSTYGGRMPTRKVLGDKLTTQVQDEATRAWNFHVALYYKSGGIPWRLIRESSAFTTCYIGIAFYKSLDEESVQTSLAQVFDERGDGMVIRGGQARISKDDLTPHLSETDTHKIITDALNKYRSEHKNYPARVVVHKSSYFTSEEREGMEAATKELNIDQLDLISMKRSLTRLFREGAYPPLRGTLWSIDEHRHILYTRGSVNFFETYPGMYVPRPLEMKIEKAEVSAFDLSRETLSLTKMNWNSTQFDHSEPITLVAAKQVGGILKYIENDEIYHPRYSFYM